jgi:hypothetical protein
VRRDWIGIDAGDPASCLAARRAIFWTQRRGERKTGDRELGPYAAWHAATTNLRLSDDHEAVSLGIGRWLALLGEFLDDPFSHRALTPGVLAEDDLQRRLDVNDLNAGVILGEQVNPSSSSLSPEVGGIDGEGQS